MSGSRKKKHKRKFALALHKPLFPNNSILQLYEGYLYKYCLQKSISILKDIFQHF